MGRRLRASALVVHGTARADPTTDRQLRGDLGRHPAGHARRDLEREPRADGRGAACADRLDDVLAVADDAAVAARVRAVAAVHVVLGLDADTAVEPVAARAPIERVPTPVRVAVEPVI